MTYRHSAVVSFFFFAFLALALGLFVGIAAAIIGADSKTVSERYRLDYVNSARGAKYYTWMLTFKNPSALARFVRDTYPDYTRYGVTVVRHPEAEGQQP